AVTREIFELRLLVFAQALDLLEQRTWIPEMAEEQLEQEHVAMLRPRAVVQPGFENLASGRRQPVEPLVGPAFLPDRPLGDVALLQKTGEHGVDPAVCRREDQVDGVANPAPEIVAGRLAQDCKKAQNGVLGLAEGSFTSVSLCETSHCRTNFGRNSSVLISGESRIATAYSPDRARSIGGHRQLPPRDRARTRGTARRRPCL